MKTLALTITIHFIIVLSQFILSLFFAIKLKHKRKLERKENEMVSTAKIYILKLLPNLKSKKSLKLILVEMNASSSILLGL